MTQLSGFWHKFANKNFSAAQKAFDTLDDKEKQEILSTLFQKAENQRTPDMISVLYRVLDSEKTFNDFHKAWLPPKQYSNPIEKGGQVYQQNFPAPTRVINAVNINNPKEVLSIGLTWVENEAQGQEMWEASTVNSPMNQALFLPAYF